MEAVFAALVRLEEVFGGQGVQVDRLMPLLRDEFERGEELPTARMYIFRALWNRSNAPAFTPATPLLYIRRSIWIRI